MKKTYLDKVYNVQGADATKALYDAWSESYEAELAENGYATPRRAAEALAAALPDRTLPILDFGCGTGLFGLALKLNGFTRIDGVDMSAEMLAQANAKSVYRTLEQIEPDGPLPNTDVYAAIAAVGVIGAGAAPLSVFDKLFAALAPRSLLCFSFNDHTLEDPSFEDRVNDVLTSDAAQKISRDYGDHLPGLNLNSVVYVIQKT
ncbi:class I SAM-dependent DNA methyltransferase [Marivita sp. S0852]|uniref:class I SAM-dependent DNA methyltransferase n=1 Tax=Marivita sp. S0852 TaxID=3373893 RepID=UPI00398241F1